MPTFALICIDKPDSLALRMANRQAHLAYSSQHLGKIRVAGEIVALSPQHIAIRRHDPKAGEVVVHFPRAGFLVLPA